MDMPWAPHTPRDGSGYESHRFFFRIAAASWPDSPDAANTLSRCSAVSYLKDNTGDSCLRILSDWSPTVCCDWAVLEWGWRYMIGQMLP
ncbi:hypothetical protein Y1Q_0001376 [Alligator mississippiensis]|uniref:Uncharacterized protein n=1 Tax=Alligator mississippiensis TaxID=8496 RepID=A0A151M9C1_ALLMI|nr:hypothetical protein Y1Q_0001376 [Alligator mississippiensis]